VALDLLLVTEAQAAAFLAPVTVTLTLSDAEVLGGTTLDLCGGSYGASEVVRLAGAGVEFLDATGAEIGASVAVWYGPGGSVAAYGELAAAVADCPGSYQDALGDTVSQTTVDTVIPPALGRQVIVTQEVTPAGAAPQWRTTAYQFDGDYLSVTSWWAADQADSLTYGGDMEVQARDDLRANVASTDPDAPPATS
jgi:hypothetical protein